MQHITGQRVVVTGAAGFIGSHLVDALLLAGASEVIAIDSLKCGLWENIQASNNDPRVTRITADLTSLGSAEYGAILNGANYLFHLAAEKHNQSKDSPARVMLVNFESSRLLFEEAARCGVDKIVFTSSLYAYGRLSGPSMREAESCSPSTIYGISKLAGEHLLLYTSKNFGIRYTALRLFFIYGPRQYAGMGYRSVIMSNFERVLRGESPVVFGDGEQGLDYVFVNDAVEALMLAAQPAVDGEVLNVSSGSAVTVSNLTDEMLKVADSGLRPVNGPADWTHGTLRVGDRSRIEQLLGWKSTTPLRDGLTRVYEWMKSDEYRRA